MKHSITPKTGSFLNHERASGILLHLTSLPGRFGIGDIGPDAYRFVDFLKAGIPLSLLLWLVATLAIPLFFPLVPA